MIAFKNARAVLGISAADVYVCPAGTTAIVLLAQVSNTTALPATATVQWTDASASDAVTRLIKDVPILAADALGCLDGKLVLEAGDKIQGYGGTASAIELSVSVLEIS